jgi:hypothetical protein
VLQDGKVTSMGLEESCKTEKLLDLGLLNLGKGIVQFLLDSVPKAGSTKF